MRFPHNFYYINILRLNNRYCVNTYKMISEIWGFRRSHFNQFTWLSHESLFCYLIPSQTFEKSKVLRIQMLFIKKWSHLSIDVVEFRKASMKRRQIHRIGRECLNYFSCICSMFNSKQDKTTFSIITLKISFSHNIRTRARKIFFCLHFLNEFSFY